MIRSFLKILGLFCLLLLAVFLLFWSAPSASVPADGKIHVRYWQATGQKDQELYSVTKFNQIQEEIRVELISIPWQEHEKKILTAILSGEPPDIISQFTPVAQLASRMALLPLDALIERDRFDSTIFFPALWEEMRWQGRIFAIPIKTASYAFFYNKRLFREAGIDPDDPPETWDEVKQLSKKLFKRDENGRIIRMGFIPEYGALPGHGDLPTAMLLAWQLGAQILRDHGTVVSLTNPQVLEALQWVVDFYDDYPVEDVTAFMAGFGYADQHAFLAEKVAMMTLASHSVRQIAEYRPNLEYGIAAIPSFPGRPTASASGSFWVAIPRGSKNAQAAWEYIKYTVSKEMQLEETEKMEEPLFPSNRFAAYDPRFITDSSTAVFVKQMEFAHSPTIVPMAHGAFWREYVTARERAVKRLASPLKALEVAQERIQIELDKALKYDQYVRSKMSFGGL